MSNIILPSDAAVTSFSTKDRLMAVPLPKKTDTYSPVPHKVVIETVLESLDKANIQVISEFYKLAKDGRQVEGHYQLSGGDSEMSPRLIFHNSYDKSMPLRVALGNHVIVCRNGVVRGDMGSFKRKHTGNILIEFQEDVSLSIQEAGKNFDTIKRQAARMKEIEITKRTTAELLGRMFIEDALVNATQLSIIKREIDNPSFNYGVEGTVWNTYNAVTVALREAHPAHYIKQHTDLHQFITAEYAI